MTEEPINVPEHDMMLEQDFVPIVPDLSLLPSDYDLNPSNFSERLANDDSPIETNFISEVFHDEQVHLAPLISEPSDVYILLMQYTVQHNLTQEAVLDLLNPYFSCQKLTCHHLCIYSINLL